MLSQWMRLAKVLFYQLCQIKRMGETMIESTTNPRIKQLVLWQSKARERKRDGVFVAEGLKMLSEAPKEWIQSIYLTKEVADKLENSKEEKEHSTWRKVVNAGYELVSRDVMQKASDTQTPQGVILVLKQPEYTLEELLAVCDGLYLVLENLQDPGNLGTIIRTGEGAGISGVIMSRDTVDIFNPKTIRSTMGSIYRVPFLYVETLTEVLKEMKKRKITTYAAHLSGKEYYSTFSFKGGTAFLIGNEGNGLQKETADLADNYLKIPMEGQVESLNAAIAASLLIYEAHRQRN